MSPPPGALPLSRVSKYPDVGFSRLFLLELQRSVVSVLLGVDSMEGGMDLDVIQPGRRGCSAILTEFKAHPDHFMCTHEALSRDSTAILEVVAASSVVVVS